MTGRKEDTRARRLRRAYRAIGQLLPSDLGAAPDLTDPAVRDVIRVRWRIRARIAQLTPSAPEQPDPGATPRRVD